MASALKLEVFCNAADVAAATWMTSDQIEAVRQAAFEAGYASGWQDCSAQLDDRQRAYNDTFEMNMQHLAFTHEEVRAQFMTSMRPVFQTMTASILPEVARHSLPGVVAELITSHAGDALDIPLILLCDPGAEAALRDKLRELRTPPLKLQPEPSFAVGQLALQWPDYECSVNITALVAAIGQAVEQFFANPDDAPEQEKFND